MIRRVAGIQFNPWDQVYHFSAGDLELTSGDLVVVKTPVGVDIGKVTGFTEVDESTLDEPLKHVMRRATAEDIEKAQQQNKKKAETLTAARDLVEKYRVAMKLVDCFFSFDGGKLTFIFTADGRVDFRELVKELARTFQKSIRLQQIGIRDEAKRMGGFGPCGRELCCRKFLGHLSSIPTDLARIQQVHSRGSDRISGSCGRLMCCLAYEAQFYEEAVKQFPPLESKVKTKHGNGQVTGYNVIKRTVTVNIDSNFVELPVKEVKRL